MCVYVCVCVCACVQVQVSTAEQGRKVNSGHKKSRSYVSLSILGWRDVWNQSLDIPQGNVLR